MGIGDYGNRLKMLERNVPQLFSCPGRVLYIGARADRCDYIPELYETGHEIFVIEAFKKNLDSLIFENQIAWLFWADVRKIIELEFPSGFFDFTCFWHGPEHLPHGDVEAYLAEFEKLTRNTIILGTPVGAVVQDEAYGNIHERHLSYWFPANFHGLGYKTDSIGTAGKMGSCILAWKELS